MFKMILQAILSFMQESKERILFRDNLKGDRLVEYSFVMANLGSNGLRTLDVGAFDSPLPTMLSGLGFDVHAVDIRNYPKFSKFRNYEFVLGDIRFIPFRKGTFDLITAISTLEHIGLKGRYQYRSREDALGDKKAIGELRRCLKTRGKIIVTLPFGHACVYRPYHRIYDKNALDSLFNGFELEKAQYFAKNNQGCWVEAPEKKCRAVNGSGKRYALGLFVLVKA